MEDKKLKLTKKQLEKINEFDVARKLFDKDLQIAKLRVELSERELKLISANYTLKQKEVNELKELYNLTLKSNNEEKEKHKQFTVKIKDDLKLSERWGYDPLTGEIKNE